jgi:hypothetical protein
MLSLSSIVVLWPDIVYRGIDLSVGRCVLGRDVPGRCPPGLVLLALPAPPSCCDNFLFAILNPLLLLQKYYNNKGPQSMENM